MAIHLILLAANKVRPDLRGLVSIYSDCLGALTKVSSLPENRIPTKYCQAAAGQCHCCCSPLSATIIQVVNVIVGVVAICCPMPSVSVVYPQVLLATT